MTKSQQVIHEVLPSGVSFDMVLVRGGRFRMGGMDEEDNKTQKPVHKVKLLSFYLGQYPVSQSGWSAVMASNPSHFNGDQRPVEMVSWEDTQEFINRVNHMTGRRYRLLSEAEWEFSASGGIFLEGEGYRFAGSDKLKQVGWYYANSKKETQKVGLKYPNEVGLYDMSGNVWEWCQDQWHDNYEGAPDDGSAWEDRDAGASHVLRGGSWDKTSWHCRVTVRTNQLPSYRNDNFGFRLALTPKPAP